MGIFQTMSDYVNDIPSSTGLVLETPGILESLPKHEDFFLGGDLLQSSIPKWASLVPDFRWQKASMYCTGYAGATIASIFERKETGQKINFSGIELFYRTGGNLKGNYLFAAASGMGEYIIPETYLPLNPPTVWTEKTFNEVKLKAKPTQQAIEIGKNYRTKQFALVKPTRVNMCAALLKSPLYAAIPGGETYNMKGVISKPKRISFLHAVVILGVDGNGNWIFFDSLRKAGETNGIRVMSYDYDILTAFSFVDLPNGWKVTSHEVRDDKFANALNHYGLPRSIQIEQTMATNFSATIKLNPTLSSLIGADWSICVNALSYGGYSEQDLLNHYTAIRRGLPPIFDLNIPRNKH